MINKKIGAILVAAGLALLLVILGKSWRRPSELPPTEMEAPTAAEETSESSRLVLEEMETPSGEVLKAVSGNLVSVRGRILILEAGSDRLQILVALDAKITRTILPSGPGDPQVSEIGLEEIPLDQQVDASVVVEGGQALATALNIIVRP